MNIETNNFDSIILELENSQKKPHDYYTPLIQAKLRWNESIGRGK